MNSGLLAAACCLGMAASLSAQEPKKADKPPAKPADAAPRRPNMTAEQLVDSILQRMDENKDGKISRAEAKDRIAANFDAIDTNKDGLLDRQELLVMARRVVASQNQPGGPRPGGPLGRPDPNDFDTHDKNADGRLTRDELKGTRFHELFDEIDTNHDGKIDPKEWEAFHKIKK